MKRVAFITTEFLSEDSTQGGIGNYIYKMASALKKNGHEPEIFVTSLHDSKDVEYDGITVHRVFVNYLVLRILRKISIILNIRSYYSVFEDLINSIFVFFRFKGVNSDVKYDIVQTPNYRFPGLLISNKKDFKLYHRISSNRILYDIAEGIEITIRQKIIDRLEIFCAKRADLIYAPSQYMANYLKDRYSLDVKVIRPPAHVTHTRNKLNEKGIKLPERYFLHFGNLGRRKGTDLVVKSLKRAWKTNPDIKIVFMGNLSEDFFYLKSKEFWKLKWNNVLVLGRVEKENVYEFVKKSITTVLPSRSDNLPNTAIESLCLNTPVIATYNSSIDEIVQHGITGILVSNNSVTELSEALIKVWEKEITFDREGISSNKLLKPLEVDTAVSNFLNIHTNN